jgi:hypothetical protein
MIWSITAPEPKANPTRSTKQPAGGRKLAVQSVNKPLMGIGITADGLNDPWYEGVVTKYFCVTTPGNGKDFFSSLSLSSGTLWWKLRTRLIEFILKYLVIIVFSKLDQRNKLGPLEPSAGAYDVVGAFVNTLIFLVLSLSLDALLA